MSQHPIEAMKQALEFFESGDFVYPTKITVDLRQAIEAAKKQEPVAWEDVLGAIARGWTHPENAQKPMDVQLAVAIAKEIQDMYTTQPATPVQVAAVKTLERLGYTYHGGEAWKPPLGQTAPVKKPMAWRHDWMELMCASGEAETKLKMESATPPAQIAPAQPVELADEQIDRAVYALTGFDGDGTQAMTIDEIRRITRATFRLATPPAAPVQEPAGEIIAVPMGLDGDEIQLRTHFYQEIPPVGTKVYYTTPPAQPAPVQEPMPDDLIASYEKGFKDGAAQRQWVGLTDKEILSDDTLRYYYGMNGGAGPVSQKGKRVVAAIEAKLRQKNT